MTKRSREVFEEADQEDDEKTFEEHATQTTQSTQSTQDSTSSGGDSETGSTEETSTGGRRIVGQVKWFNVKKGWGFIIGENGEDIFVHQSGVNKAGFRSLDDGEYVEYEIRSTDKGPEACNITGPSGSTVLGSQRRKRMRILQKQRKNRCFNCNGEGHIASSCPCPSTPKRCHVCLKDDHLMRQCPHQPVILPGDQDDLDVSSDSGGQLRAGSSSLVQPPPPPPPPPNALLSLQLQQQIELLNSQQHLELLNAQQQMGLLNAGLNPQLMNSMASMGGLNAPLSGVNPQLNAQLNAQMNPAMQAQMPLFYQQSHPQQLLYHYYPRFPPGPPL